MSKAWYIRLPGDVIKGPFPAGQISQEILLGRYTLKHEVSHDKEEWLPIRQVPGLIPDVFKGDQSDPDFRNKVAAARRWADERRGIDALDGDERRQSESSYETKEMKRLHQMAAAQNKPTNPLVMLIQFIVVVSLIAGLIWLAFEYSPKATNEEASCGAPAYPGVNWSHCSMVGKNLSGAQLSSANMNSVQLNNANLANADLSKANLIYANLQLAVLKNANLATANLKGANLQSADLSYARLSGADLSYANLSGANLTATDFSGVKLGHTIWNDGRQCREDSVGVCR